ncbi:SMI1/KNR4 family protein [Bacillaceae bacterium Marseille-Q3522]|nr:SMI1/KNR4 family protein [Bacillaceae bacterium Marseille-Q3522]
MGSKSFIKLTIQGLKQKLEKDNSLIIQRHKGAVLKVTCKFNEPALIENVIDFEKETGWNIPEDLQRFLLIHNGALIFESEYGGGLHLYSLDEMKSIHLPHMSDYCYPIGCYEGEYLFVDSKKLDIKI